MRKAWLIALLVLLSLTSVSTVSMARVTLHFAIHTAPGGPEFEAAQYFEKLVEERSNGEIQVELYPGAVLGGERDNIEQLTVGEVAMTLNGDLLSSLLAPEWDPTIIPFVMPNTEAALDYWNGPFGEKLKKAIEERGNILVVGLTRRGARHLTSNVPVRTPEDIRGMKLRVPEITTWVTVWKQVGALVTPIAWPEVYSALQMGVVDGQENPIPTIYTARLWEVQNYLVLTEHVPALWRWSLSKPWLERLTPEQQQIVLEAAAEAAKWGDDLTIELDQDYLERLKANGMEVIVPDKAAFAEAAMPAINEIARDWAPGVLEAVQSYR